MSYRILSVDISNKQLVEEFLRNAGNSLDKFRYFQSRPVEVIKNHIVTLVALNEKKAVGYGHLDKENEITWLGTAVVEDAKGKGIGKMILERLVEEAKKNKIKKIRLSVDNDNAIAIALYKKYGFVLFEKKEVISFYEKEIEL